MSEAADSMSLKRMRGGKSAKEIICQARNLFSGHLSRIARRLLLSPPRDHFFLLQAADTHLPATFLSVVVVLPIIVTADFTVPE
jgi:hypothetical protein